MKKKIFGILITLMLAVSLLMVPAVAAEEEADTVYLNGNIYTVDDAFSTASAMAIKGDRFIYVGSDVDIQSFIGDGTAVIDLNGKTVVPGLIDSHMHFSSVGQKIYSRDVDCWHIPLDEMLSRIAAAIADPTKWRPGPEGWIQGRGYDEALWDPPVAHKDLLDPISPDNPVYISRYCGHGGLANSLAMEICGITDETPDPPGGTIERDAEGHATGVFIERATRLITQHIPSWPPLTEEERRYCLQLGSEAVLAAGLTGVHDASGAGMSTIERRSDLYEAGLLKVRINNMLSRSTAEALGAPQIGLYDNQYTLVSVKVSGDGSLGARGAAMLEEYSDAPGYFGLLKIEEDPFALQVAELLELGFSTRTHCIGDLANRVALNAYEKALAMTDIAGEDARLGIEHSSVIHPDDMPRYAELGVVANVQPIFVADDWQVAGWRLGPEREDRVYAFKTLLDLGVHVSFGTDYSVDPYDPFLNLHTAVNRQDYFDQPPGGWRPDQRLTREEALRCYTMGGAYASFEEDIKGSIEVGKLADFVVIDRDYMTCPVIKDIKVLMTVLGGEIVYSVEAIVDIDIKPGSYPNSINLKSTGVVPVAVLTTDDFDASTVDPETVGFAGAGAVRWTLEDVDGDGDLDMLFHFKTENLALIETSTVATLNGTTYAGVVFQGTDTVNIVPD